MAWNEPGNNQNGHKPEDPKNGRRGQGEGPPDLDEVFQNLKSHFKKKGGPKRPSGPSQPSGDGTGFNPGLLLFLLPVVLVIWLLTGFYIVQPGEKGVVLKFGEYTQTVDSGLHWYWPTPVGRVLQVDTQQVRSASTSSVALTKEESLADIRVSLQYRVSDAKNYLFALTQPNHTVEQVLKSAVREIVGTSRLNQVIQEGVQPDDLDVDALENVDLKESDDEEQTTNPLNTLDADVTEKVEAQKADYPAVSVRSRAALPENIKNIIQASLDRYQAGLQILAVNVEYAQPPEQVQSAFEEAIRAREEKERKKNIARAYARKITSRVVGQEAEILARAKAVKAQKIADAEGDADRFNRLVAQYQRAPEVTRQRLYLEAMQEVLSNAKVILSQEGDHSPMLYMPLPESSSSSNSSDDATAKTDDNIDQADFVLMDDDSDYTSQPDSSSTSLRSRER